MPIPNDQLADVPKREAYMFSKYSYPSRFASYFYQLREVLDLNPKSVLEVGVGDKVFGSYLLNNSDVQYKSVDFSEDLKPDIVGSVTKLPIQDKSFDLVCAFEVLEHVPFEHFETALKELSRVSIKNVVISLPHFGPSLEFSIKIPFFHRIQIALKIPFAKKHIFNGRHYWEIGKKNYSISKILSIFEKYFIVRKHFVPFENQYHHFFILEKK